MKSCCILIQCYVKPDETIQVLQSLERCPEINEYSLVLYCDFASPNTKFEKSNRKLIQVIHEYKNQKINLFKEIIVKVEDQNLGPYLCCGKALDWCFEHFDFVVFSEDDAIFTRDSLTFYNQFRDIKINIPENCIGITAYSYRYSKENSKCGFREEILREELLNKVEKVNQAPNKQFGLFREQWKRIRYFRTSEYKGIDVPDYATLLFVQKNQMFFYYSVVPRTNDVGLFHPLGCSHLYFDQKLSLETLKWITTDDFDHNLESLVII